MYTDTQGLGLGLGLGPTYVVRLGICPLMDPLSEYHHTIFLSCLVKLQHNTGTQTPKG